MNRHARAGIALVAALLLCGALIGLGPMLAERVLTAMAVESAAAGEALFTLMIFGALLLAAVVAGAVSGVNALAPGGGAARWAPVGLAIGLGGVSLAAGYAVLAGTLAPASTATAVAPGMLMLGVATVLVQVLAEEAFFRGWLQPVLARAWGTAAAVGIAAVAFAALHVAGGARAPVTLVNLALGGVVFGLLAVLGRGIAAPLMMHWGWNGAEQLLLGLDPNPGLGGFGALWDLELAGAGLWGGSAEGLNASLGMTAVLLAVLLPLLVATRRRGAGEAPVRERTVRQRTVRPA